MQAAAAGSGPSATAGATEIDLKCTLSPPDSSIDELEYELEDEGNSYTDELGDLDADLPSGELPRKPHFLDYDNKPPAGYEEEQEVALRQPGASTDVRPPAVETAGLVVAGDHAAATAMEPQPCVTISQSVTEERPAAKMETVPAAASHGTWPVMERPAQAGRRQNYSMYDDLSEICPKMECVYSLLSMLGSSNSLEMSSKFVELSRNREKCSALRRSGCIPLLVHIIHNDPNETARRNARQALTNVICCHPDDKTGRREVKVLKLIDQLIDHTDQLKVGSSAPESTEQPSSGAVGFDPERHPIQAIGTMAKISFDEEHRHAMCLFGALQTIATLIQLDHAVHGTNAATGKCVTMRRYAGMILTNLTFGDGNNKSLLCSNKNFMKALVAQIESSSDELVQVTASVLRNLSWRADTIIKQTLSEIGTVKILTGAAMSCTIESTLKAILSALWNLSNHCPPNKSEFCEVSGALEFLIDMLSYDAPSKTMSVVENAGGILRNISSHIAQCEDYRKILRKKNCLKILLQQLKSASLTVVSNACGTLGNLSGNNYEDQKFLRDNGAIPMLRSLIYSKHKMISNGSSLALKNLQSRPPVAIATSASVAGVKLLKQQDSSSKEFPTLNVRKKKALEQELERDFFHKTAGERDVCTSSHSSSRSDEEQHNRSSPEVNHDAVHIRLVEDQDVPETEPEQPVNYSLKEELQQVSYDYQETDVDQLTDYSLRYAENQSDSDDEKGEEQYNRTNSNVTDLISEDSVKCYYTEGTPHIISSATSMSDLRAPATNNKQPTIPKSNPIPIVTGITLAPSDDTGCNTPDKPFNYCEEGTPDFSRDASLNVLDLPGDAKPVAAKEPSEALPDQATPTTPGTVTKSVSFLNTAEETPLMFSRTSSMGSLSSAEPVCTDDKSSIVSEFSRFASGVISPSDLPDSPTQTMPHSPRRSASGSMSVTSSRTTKDKADLAIVPQPPQKSAFEDAVNQFNVENTPAHFSCATSLSNLSIEDKEDDESKLVVDVIDGSRGPPTLPMPVLEPNGSKPESVASDDGEPDSSGDDDMLLESCISMGMNSVMGRSVVRKINNVAIATAVNVPAIQRTNAAELVGHMADNVQQYRTEDTATMLPNVTGNCDLGNLSIDIKNDHDSDDSSNVSDNNDRLLEECIRNGMPKPKQQALDGEVLVKENPIKMMRNPVHLQPLYANDEVSPFFMEDSPCNFSTTSALSDLTVASDAGGAPKPNRNLSSKMKETTPRRPSTTANDSLSSLSVESENDEHLLDEAIAAGIESKARNRQKRAALASAVTASGVYLERPTRPTITAESAILAARPVATADKGNDSLDSIDSVDSNDPQNDTLLEQAIENGMKKLTEKRNEQHGKFEFQAGMMMYQNLAKPDDSISDSDRYDNDYELLMECIHNGMPKSNRNAPLSPAADLTQNLQQLTLGTSVAAITVGTATVTTANPKNVDTTPVITMDVGAITNVISAGVVKCASSPLPTVGTSVEAAPEAQVASAVASASIMPTSISNSSSNITTTITTTITFSSSNSNSCNSNTNRSHITTTAGVPRRLAARSEAAPEQPVPEAQLPPPLQPQRRPQPQTEMATSMTELSGCDGGGLAMERSNEYPAFSVDEERDAFTDSVVEMSASTSELQISNEFMVDSTSEFAPKDKHKDPDLMLKSVERLTQELVSTAEYLRTASNKDSSNTWNEDDSCANDFPSLSQMAPRVHSSSLDDDDTTVTISEEIDSKQLDALEDLETPVYEQKPLPGGSNEDLSRDTVHFQLGGEVNSQVLAGAASVRYQLQGGTTENQSFSTVSTLTNSTIIAIEASKVACDLQNMAIVECADLDLSKINPDSILISDCSDSEATFRNDSRRILLPSGLVAKRALGQTFNDSLSSLHNIDSIGPPSIMDELMDSMISVASIASEVVDLSIEHTPAVSEVNMSSANSSSTLNSSFENLIRFSPSVAAAAAAATSNSGGSYGFSGMDAAQKSTPLSPKRAERRQLMKDRYKTYTIPTAELVDLNQTLEDMKITVDVKPQETPRRMVTVPSPKKTPKERRIENKSRYETQVISSSDLAEFCADGGFGSRWQPFVPLTLEEPSSNDDEPLTYTVSSKRVTSPQHVPVVVSCEQVTTVPTVAPATSLAAPMASPVKRQSPAKSVLLSPVKMATPARTTKAPVPQVQVPASESQPKPIRGTKKAPYVSPYRKSLMATPTTGTTPRTSLVAARRESTPVASNPPKFRTQLSAPAEIRPKAPLKARVLPSKRNSLEITGTPRLKERQRSSGSPSKKPATVSRPEPAEPSAGAATLIRQGTFTKDEPTNPAVPVVTSAPSTPSKSLRKSGSMIPSSASSSRLTTIARSRIVLQKSVSMDASKHQLTPVGTGASCSGSADGTPTFGLRLSGGHKKPVIGGTGGSRLSGGVSSSSEQLGGTAAAGVSSPTTLIPTMRRKSGIALPKRTNLTMKSNPDVLKGKLDGVRNAFARTTAPGQVIKTGTR